MRRMISILMMAAGLGPLLTAEEVAATYAGHPVMIEWPAAAQVAGITPTELLASARHAATSSLPAGRPLPPTQRIAALMDGQAMTLDGRIAVGLVAGTDPDILARRAGLAMLEVHGRVVVLGPAAGSRLAALRALPSVATDPQVTWSEPVVVRQFRPRVDPTDPGFVQQWFLKNTGPGQIPGLIAGNDLNVLGAWQSATGVGVRVGVVDTGVLLTHEDLVATIGVGEGHDFIGNDANASPGTAAGLGHGTEVAGLIAAGSNGTGVVGVAYDATLVPLRLIGDAVTTTDTANALTWNPPPGTTEVQVSNNSWGPDDDGVDDGALAENPSTVELNAMDVATATGRVGRGVLLVWASGNGGANGDTCDRDGYANSRFVIAVGATNGDGTRSFYSEMGACLFVNAPVGDTSSIQALSTACNPANQSLTNLYVKGMGTSFAAPMVSGVIALMLQANPNLTWRDVRDILARSAAKNDPADANWLTNGAGLHWNLQYGFGRVDALAAVTAASAAVTLPLEATPLTVSTTPDLTIPDPGSTADIALLINGPVTGTGDPLFRCESVELTVDASHPFQGDLAFTLTSPRGTMVTFLARPNDTSPARVWTMSSVATWGEAPDGTWTLKATDVTSGYSGSLHAATMTIHGHVLNAPTTSGTATATTVNTPIINASGSTTISPIAHVIVPPPAPAAPASNSGGGGGGCGLGAGSLGLLMSALLALRLRLRRIRHP